MLSTLWVIKQYVCHETPLNKEASRGQYMERKKTCEYWKNMSDYWKKASTEKMCKYIKTHGYSEHVNAEKTCAYRKHVWIHLKREYRGNMRILNTREYRKHEWMQKKTRVNTEKVRIHSKTWIQRKREYWKHVNTEKVRILKKTPLNTENVRIHKEWIQRKRANTEKHVNA